MFRSQMVRVSVTVRVRASEWNPLLSFVFLHLFSFNVVCLAFFCLFVVVVFQA